MSVAFDAISAYDEAFSGKATHVIDHVGRTQPFEVGAWSSEPDRDDRALFIDPCRGATVDVGCGPGRLVGELTARRIPAMGIDVSSEAVRQTRVRGALALRRDVFDTIPGEGHWECALLADGNLGIGGDPVRLLRRIAELLTPEGRVIAEVAGAGTGLVHERRRLRVAGRTSVQFAWSVVGLDAVDEVADRAGMRVVEVRTSGGRHAATLAPVRP